MGEKPDTIEFEPLNVLVPRDDKGQLHVSFRGLTLRDVLGFFRPAVLPEGWTVEPYTQAITLTKGHTK